MQLSFGQRMRFGAHLFKAIFYSYHQPLAQKLRVFLSPNAVIFDVGAHSGQFSKLFSKLVPKGAVFAFEPGEYAGAILRRVVKHRRLRNVHIVPQGLSDSEGDQTLYLPVKGSGALGFGLSSLLPNPKYAPEKLRTQTISLTTIDQFVAKRHVSRVDLIKIDIEGWELPALKGGELAIARFRPVVLIEIAAEHQARTGAKPEDFFVPFASLDYVAFKTLEKQDYQTQRVSGYEGDGDYLFVPKERAMLMGV